MGGKALLALANAAAAALANAAALVEGTEKRASKIVLRSC